MTFKPQETRALVEILAVLLQIRYQILTLYKSTDNEIQSIADLPPSMIPTDLLFDITICFEGMFEELQKHKLLKEGHMNLSHTTH